MRPSAAPLDAQPVNPRLGRLSMNEDMLYHKPRQDILSTSGNLSRLDIARENSRLAHPIFPLQSADILHPVVFLSELTPNARRQAHRQASRPTRGSRRYQQKIFGKRDSDEITAGRQKRLHL